MKKISVIIPIYNAEKYIKDCLESVINQTYKNLEIILIDDGSKDNSKIICEKYALKDKRIKFISNSNHGVSYSRNYGIKLSSGDGIIFIDSDDYVKLNYIEKLVSFFDNNDLIICNVYDFYEKYNKCISRKIDFKNLTGLWKKDIYILGSIIFYPHLKLYKTNIIKENNIFFPDDMVTAEDQIFNYQYLKYVKKYKYIDEPLYIYMQRENISLSRVRTVQSFESEIKCINFKQDFFKDMNVLNKNKMLIEQLIYITTEYIKIDNRKNNFNEYKKRINRLNKISIDNTELFTKKEKLMYILLKNNCHKLIYFLGKLRSYKIRLKIMLKDIYYKIFYEKEIS